MAEAKITGIFRFPVKGLTGEELASADLTAGNAIPGDRAYAIEAGTGKFDTAEPRHLPKTNFVTLAREKRLAALESAYDADGGILTISRKGRQVARGNLNERIGRQLLEQFFAAFVPETSRGAPKIVSGGPVSLSDVPIQVVSIINLATVRDIERVAGVTVDPARFRGNILIDGVEPWAEIEWLDKTLAVNGVAALDVIDRIGRCPATNVNPKTAARDMTIPRLLLNAFGHRDCGVYAKVVENVTIKLGDALGVVP